MSTIAERHEADQDDADRYADRFAQRNGHVTEMATEIERLRQKHNAIRAEYDGLRVEWGEAIATIAERDATIERLTDDRNHPYGDVAPTDPAPDLERDPNAASPVGSVHIFDGWHSSTSQCVRCLRPGEFAS